jgi:hypothetical protein
MLTILLTYADGSSRTISVHDNSQLMDVASLHDAESAEIVSYCPSV